MADQEHEYEIGYGNPPRESRFVKGMSGNPQGRPKRSMNLATMFKKISNEPIKVTENGRSRTISKIEAVPYQLIKKALSGDPRAMKDYFRLQQFSELSEELEEDSGSAVLHERDAEVMKSFLTRIQRMETIPADEAQRKAEGHAEEE